MAHPALDAGARLALFRCCHALARMVLVHRPSSTKRITHKCGDDGGGPWSPTLAHLLGVKWQPLPSDLDLELRVEGKSSMWSRVVPSHLPAPPPTSLGQHISRLHLLHLILTTPDLVAWQLHDWPQLQHLTIQFCDLREAGAATAPGPPLQPIPRLQSVDWRSKYYPEGDGDDRSLVPLLSNAQRARLGEHRFFVLPPCTSMVQRMPRLMHLELDGSVGDDTLRELIPHPTLEHLTLDSLSLEEDLSKEPCRWKTISMTDGASLHDLARLPWPGLQRLNVRGALEGKGKDASNEECAAGVAALQRLHGEGRLALLPRRQLALSFTWALSPDDRMFSLYDVGACAPALLRLVVEAGPGINTLTIDSCDVALPLLRGEVAPLLQQQGGRIRTLCVDLRDDVTEEWCAGLLGALPTCVPRVKVFLDASHPSSLAVAVVRGGVQAVRHPLQLTLLHRRAIGAGTTAELRELVAGGGGEGGGGTGGVVGPQQPAPAWLALELVHAPRPFQDLE